MELSQRLFAIAAQVPSGSRIADIGTDHGYIPIFLYQTNKIRKAIAADIHIGPLEKAKRNIISHHGEHIIETRLGDGLEKILPGEVDVLIIAGMGGMLMIDILKKGMDVVQSCTKLILQPQLDMDQVRRYLHTIGFMIQSEQMVLEDGKYYTIITAVRGNEAYEKEEFYTFGKRLIEQKDEVLRGYLEYKRKQIQPIKESLESQKSESARKRLTEIEKEEAMYEEVLSWI